MKLKRFQLCKVAGLEKPADVMTKPASATEMPERLARIGAPI